MGSPMFFKRSFLDKQRARELYDEGYCDQQIADLCDSSREAVKSWRKREGLQSHKAPYKKKEEKRESTLIEMAAEAKRRGMSYGEYMAKRKEAGL